MLKDSVADYKHLKKKGVCYCYAETLIDNGYGDVSEYKAEIEHLRTALGQCNTELNSALKSLKSQCREIGELKAKNKVLGDGVAKAFTNGFNTGREQVEKDIRRAKIGILNRLKRIMTAYSWQIDINDVQKEINELIKEVQDGKDKG